MWDSKLGIFYDAKFTTMAREAELISIGMVSQNGSNFYAEFTDFNGDDINDWTKDNIIGNLLYFKDNYILESSFVNIKNKAGCLDDEGSYNVRIKGDKFTIRKNLTKWLERESKLSEDKQIQIFSDCYVYDIMLLNNLLSDDNALHVPSCLYFVPVDLSTILYYSGIDPRIDKEEFIGEFIITNLKYIDPFTVERDTYKHNALWDAYVSASCYGKIVPKEVSKGVTLLLS